MVYSTWITLSVDQTMAGQKLPLKMQVEYMSFSAHVDYRQISGNILRVV